MRFSQGWCRRVGRVMMIGASACGRCSSAKFDRSPTPGWCEAHRLGQTHLQLAGQAGQHVQFGQLGVVTVVGGPACEVFAALGERAVTGYGDLGAVDAFELERGTGLEASADPLPRALPIWVDCDPSTGMAAASAPPRASCAAIEASPSLKRPEVAATPAQVLRLWLEGTALLMLWLHAAGHFALVARWPSGASLGRLEDQRPCLRSWMRSTTLAAPLP